MNYTEELSGLSFAFCIIHVYGSYLYSPSCHLKHFYAKLKLLLGAVCSSFFIAKLATFPQAQNAKLICNTVSLTPIFSISNATNI